MRLLLILLFPILFSQKSEPPFMLFKSQSNDSLEFIRLTTKNGYFIGSYYGSTELVNGKFIYFRGEMMSDYSNLKFGNVSFSLGNIEYSDTAFVEEFIQGLSPALNPELKDYPTRLPFFSFSGTMTKESICLNRFYLGSMSTLLTFSRME